MATPEIDYGSIIDYYHLVVKLVYSGSRDAKNRLMLLVMWGWYREAIIVEQNEKQRLT